jgi:glycerol 3-phosphatase-2
MQKPTVAGADWAFKAYETARHRLPQASFFNQFERAETLRDIADQFDTFLLDGFGVLNVGTAPIPGACERVEELRTLGKRVLLVTNSASKSKPGLVARYAKLGFEFNAKDIISSRDPLLAAVENAPKYTWGLIADPAFGTEGIAHFDARFLADVPATYDAVDAFMMLGCTTWTEVRQDILTQSLRRNSRPVFIGNPDISAPSIDGMSRQPGYFAHRLADATGVEPKFFGKPFSNIFEQAFARLDGDFDPARTLMVGDTLHTDILGGRVAGVKTALISDYGSLTQTDVKAAIKISNIVPDYVLSRP